MNELSVTCHIAAPPEKVWQVLAHRKAEWWCPLPWRASFDVDEQWPGGRSEVTMHGPDGEVHPDSGIYLAFEEGRRFATTDAITGDLEPAGPFMIGIWEIAPEAGGTRYTARARHWTEENRRQHEEMGFIDGWAACMAQLKSLCEKG